MADKLRVSTEKLKSTSREYGRLRNSMQQTCTQIRNTAQGSAEFWEGSAGNAFRDRFSVMFGELKQTDEKMQDAVDELLKTAGIFEESERKNTGAAQALEIGVSPFA